MEMILDALLDAVLDTAKLVPFLFITYMGMEYLEHKAEKHTTGMLEKAGHFGPLIGAVVGILPQCGFSAAASSLFAGGVISVGTLIAVFLSTSDEMLPIFISEGVHPSTMLRILATKAMLGLVSGFLLDIFMRHGRHTKAPEKHIHDLCVHEHCACDDDEEDEDELHDEAHAHDEHRVELHMADASMHIHDGDASHAHDVQASHHSHQANADDHAHHHGAEALHSHEHAHAHAGHHHHHHQKGFLGIAMPALHHTIQITGFIFFITLIITLLVEGIGAEAIGHFLSGKPIVGVFLAGVVGLIPNCAASVSITQLYLMGILNAGQMMAGLLVGAGVGLLVLFRTNDHPNENLRITIMLYGLGVFWGLVIEYLGIVF